MIWVLPPIVNFCTACKAKPTEDHFCDLVTISVDGRAFTICHDCAHELIGRLIGRYYPLWGQAVMNADAVDAENEACARIADAEAERQKNWRSDEVVQTAIEIAAAIRARRKRGENEQGD